MSKDIGHESDEWDEPKPEGWWGTIIMIAFVIPWLVGLGVIVCWLIDTSW